MARRNFTVDQWSPLSFKPAFDQRLVGAAPTWVDDDNRRRLEGYILLSAYLENVAREYLASETEEKRAERREYGDAALIVDTLVDAVLGENTRVMVDGARRTDKPDEFADTLQDFFDEWVDREWLLTTVFDAESDTVGLGDGIYEVAWDSEKQRATVCCYDPGFYFPVLDPAEAKEQFPTKIHLAWEFERWNADYSQRDKFIRKITYELVNIETLDPDRYDTSPRRYPWNEEPSTLVCLKSDGTWAWEDLGSRNWLQLTDSRARWEINANGNPVNRLDIGADFIPVIHVPNTISRKEHFGRSALAKILQILDDIQSTDTDLLKTSRTTGSPPLGSKSPVQADEDGTVTTYGPGTVIQGEITVIDTSRNLDALLKYIEELLKRLSTNIRMPESVLGKLRPSEVPSGIALALSFGPLRSLVRRMRLARAEKYPLLLKFVHRFHMVVDNSLVSTSPPNVQLAFGQFLPSDRTALIDDILKLLGDKAISRDTAIRFLIEMVGLDIRAAEEEVKAIQAEDLEGARVLSEALESPEAAAEYLGVQVPEISEARKNVLKLEAENRPTPFGGGNQNNGSQTQPQSQ